MTVVPDRALVRMTGPDAVAHLQSMVSNDVEAIPSGGGAYALLLTPKARVISDLEVFNTPAGLVLACPPETRDDVVDVLVRARFRKKVELEAAAGKRLAELTGAEWGMVSAGCSAAISHATAACVAGGNPEMHVRLPDLTGFPNLTRNCRGI
jgi:folate-binding Fe-S cluster repair protein YgfZ